VILMTTTADAGSRTLEAALRDAALRLAAAGLPVFPCRGKVPATARGFYNATTDAEQIRRWRWYDAIGVRTGDGLIVLDVDPRHGGDASLAELEAEHGEILTLTARTGGGGMHLYMAGDLPARNGVRPGLDLKAAGGYVIAPPSLHASGQRYEWIAPEDLPQTPQPAPAWLGLIVSPPREARPLPRQAVDTVSSNYIATAIERECIGVAFASEGTRNETLNRAAWALARFVLAGQAHGSVVREALFLAARHAGLNDIEIQKTIRSAFRGRSVA
jgi:hypothetical protein